MGVSNVGVSTVRVALLFVFPIMISLPALL